jgi:hypothetical protein
MKKTAVLMIGILTAAQSARPEILAGWDMAGVDVNDGIGLATNAPPYAFAATTGDTVQVQARLELGDGVNPSTSADQYGFKIPTEDTADTLAEALAGNHYLEFSLTVPGSCRINLESIEMRGQSTSSGCSNVVLMSSIDGFAAGQEIAAAYAVNKTGGFDTDSSGFGAPIDLSDSRYQQLTGTVAFRLYGWSSVSGSGAAFLRNLNGDDLIVYGTCETLPAGSGPVLSISESNGTCRIAAVVEEGNENAFVLQYCSEIDGSNGWSTVSAPFTDTTAWLIDATNRTGFYRAAVP